MAMRGSDKHNPRLDDLMEEEVEGTLRGTEPTRVEEGREQEPTVTDTGEAATGPDVMEEELESEESEETEER